MPKRYDNAFLFFVTFADAIREIPDRDTQLECFWAIVNYGLYGEEPQTDNPWARSVFHSFKFNIGVAKLNYGKKIEENKGGRPPKLPHDEMVRMKEEGMTASEVAQKVDCSERQVYNVWSKDREARQEEAEVPSTVSEMADSNTTEQDNEATGVSTGTTATVGSNAGRMQGGYGKEVDNAPGRLPSELKLIEAEHIRDLIERGIPLREIEAKHNIKRGTLTKGFWDSYEINQVKPLFEQLNISERDARYINDEDVAIWPYPNRRNEEKEHNMPDGTITRSFWQFYTKYTVPAQERAKLERNVSGDITGNNKVNEVTQETQGVGTDETEFDEDAMDALIEAKYGDMDDYPPF